MAEVQDTYVLFITVSEMALNSQLLHVYVLQKLQQAEVRVFTGFEEVSSSFFLTVKVFSSCGERTATCFTAEISFLISSLNTPSFKFKIITHCPITMSPAGKKKKPFLSVLEIMSFKITVKELAVKIC